MSPAPAAVVDSKDLAKFLSKIPLFARLNYSQCVSLAGLCRQEVFPKGSLIFREGDFGDAACIVESGILEVFKKDVSGDVRISEVRPGGLVGEMSLIDRGPRSASIRAVSDARVILLQRDRYEHLKKTDPALILVLQDELLTLLTRRLRQTTRRLVEEGTEAF